MMEAIHIESMLPCTPIPETRVGMAECVKSVRRQYHSTLTAFTFQFLITAMPSKEPIQFVAG